MVLTPSEVEQKAFTQALRGYHMDEVDDFLDEVVTALRSYDQRVRDAQERIRALEAELASRGHEESAISRAFLAAQRSADGIVAEAQAEAERIRSTAHQEADQLSAQRDAQRQAALAEMESIRQAVEGLRARLTDMAGTLSGGLDSMDAAIAESRIQVGGQPGPRAVESPPPPVELFEATERVDEPERVEVPRAGSRPWERT
jgi:cell division initiation protein